MHLVLAYIDQHLDGPLDLGELAGVASYSSFHFHRLFGAWAGERLGDYLRRRRLEMAAVRLSSQPDTTVLAVAMAVGFSSGEAFSRAFKEHFGAAPSAWRAAAIRNPDQVLRKLGHARRIRSAEDGRESVTEASIPMNVSVIDRTPRRVTYLRRTGAYGEGLSIFWQEDVYPWMVRHDLLGAPRYGISLDDPSITAPAQCRYDACVEIAADRKLPRDILTATIPGGRYAVVEFEDTVEAMAPVWDALLRDWLPGSGFQLDARPMFEYYASDATYHPDTGVMQCEICIPVAPA